MDNLWLIVVNLKFFKKNYEKKIYENILNKRIGKCK